MSEWIRVDFQLPSNGIRVLVTDKNSITTAEYDPEWFPKAPWIFDELALEEFTPTHWMPMPEPPMV